MSEAEIGAYRSVSGMAIAALLLGLASPLAALAPLCFVFPLAACVVGSIAWLRVTRNPELYTGAGLALAGAALGALAGAGVVGLQGAEHARLGAQAREFARDWTTLLLSDDPSAAFALVDHRQPPPPEPGAAPDPQSEESRSPEESFLATEPTPSLRSLGQGAEIEPGETFGLLWLTAGRVQMMQRLRVGGGESGQQVILALERRTGVAGMPAVWRVLSLREGAGPAG